LILDFPDPTIRVDGDQCRQSVSGGGRQVFAGWSSAA